MDFYIGLRNALGVALPLAIGIAIKMPLGGLAVASGALNVSYSDGHDPYWQRAKRMLATSALCAIAVMAGGLSGHYSVLAVLLSSFWAFWAGFVIALGPTAESQGVISVVVTPSWFVNDRLAFGFVICDAGRLVNTVLFGLAKACVVVVELVQPYVLLDPLKVHQHDVGAWVLCWIGVIAWPFSTQVLSSAVTAMFFC